MQLQPRIGQRHITNIIKAMLVACTVLTAPAIAEDKIKLETITIKGNKELPKILYVVPWQEAQRTKQKKQKLKLHRFFGELYEPISVEAPKTQFD